jgi:hypothetical protein
VTRMRPGGEVVKVWDENCAGGLSTEITGTPGWCTPASFDWHGTHYRIRKVCTRWRIHTRWWEPDQALWREYLKVLVVPEDLIAPAMMASACGSVSNSDKARGSLLCLLYRNLLSGDWFLARIYD